MFPVLSSKLLSSTDDSGAARSHQEDKKKALLPASSVTALACCGAKIVINGWCAKEAAVWYTEYYFQYLWDMETSECLLLVFGVCEWFKELFEILQPLSGLPMLRLGAEQGINRWNVSIIALGKVMKSMNGWWIGWIKWKGGSWIGCTGLRPKRCSVVCRS